MISSSAKVVAILRSILLTVTALVMICTALPSCAPQTAEIERIDIGRIDLTAFTVIGNDAAGS